MKSNFRLSYLLQVFGLAIFIIIIFIFLPLFFFPINDFLSIAALTFYFSCLLGLIGVAIVFYGFKIILLTEDSIIFKSLSGRTGTISFQEVTGYKTYYLKRTASSNESGTEVKDYYKSLAIFFKQNDRIEIHGSMYCNFEELVEYIIKRIQ